MQRAEEEATSSPPSGVQLLKASGGDAVARQPGRQILSPFMSPQGVSKGGTHSGQPGRQILIPFTVPQEVSERECEELMKGKGLAERLAFGKHTKLTVSITSASLQESLKGQFILLC